MPSFIYPIQTPSSQTRLGNHAAALALAARESGMPAHIVMPTISAPPKIAATRGYGANVIFSGSTSAEREAVAEQVIRDTGARFVSPFDHPDIMLGQGTMGIEFQAQVAALVAAEVDSGSRKGKGKGKGLDAIIAPCGGGGMLSGVALSCEGTDITVFGAEPEYQVRCSLFRPSRMLCGRRGLCDEIHLLFFEAFFMMLPQTLSSHPNKHK